MSPLEFPVSSIQEPLSVSGKYFREGRATCFLRAVTFGPFPAGAFPDEGMAQLERVRQELGANTIRVYEIPSLPFLHECARVGLRVFITLPWSQHIDFLKKREILAEADRLLLETIRQFRGHPALAGYFVGNEIETTLVRWMGRRNVQREIERLIDLGHANDPEALFSYATYPSTEYLLPVNQDFVSFNLYLEQRESLAAYLARLQNLAGDKPLLISEFGVDSRTHGELTQAEMLEWHVEEACRAGAAGTTIFAWSDLWQRGGKTIEDYDFGVTRRDRSARPALAVVREKWATFQRPSDEIQLPRIPKISVIVCTYRGSATLVECLDSVTALDYPDYEVVLVNDGGDSRVNELAESYPEVRRVSVEHQGLSAARNLGAENATGEILAFTDDDCIAEPDWLVWIAKMFLEDESLGCAGGPNIPPPPESRMQARIAAAPGGPVHVLLTDTRAEHLPGCNLAVRRSALEAIGGFNPIFRSAGDDVDFCWRVVEAGYELGFHAGAFVWHHRRFTLRDYLRQQIGYGKAEALLLPLHRERFRGLGGAVWNGQVYAMRTPGRGFVYHGHYGYEPFQLIYPDPEAGMSEVCLHALWWLPVLLLVAASWASPWLLLPAGLMVYASLRIAWSRARRAPLTRTHDSFSARTTVAALVLLQGFLRSGARLMWGWREAKWSRGVEAVTTATWRRVTSGWWKLGYERAFWSEDGTGRDELLSSALETISGAEVDETGRTDLILKRGWFWNWAMVTATEYHEDGGRLTRIRLLARPQRTTRMIVLPLLVSVAVGIPVALAAGGVLHRELLILAVLIYVAGSIIAQAMVRSKLPGISRAAAKAGLTPA